MSKSTKQYEQRLRLKELAGYVALIERELSGTPWGDYELLRAVLRLCELLVPQCGPDDGQLRALQLRMGVIRERLTLDYEFQLEDTAEHTIVPQPPPVKAGGLFCKASGMAWQSCQSVTLRGCSPFADL